MKINEILSESRKRTKKIDEAPVSMLGQGARRVGSWALDKIGAVNTAGKLTGIANTGVEANKLSKEFHTYLGRSGIAAPQYEDLVDFLTSKGLTVPNEIQGKTGAMPSKAADKMIMRAVSQPHDLGNSRRSGATQSNTQNPSASGPTPTSPAGPAPQNPANPAATGTGNPSQPATNSSVSYSQVKQMVDQLSGNSLVMLKRYVDSKVNKSASNLGLNPGGPNTATPPVTPAPAAAKPKKSSKAAPNNSAKPKKQSAAKPAPVTPPTPATPPAAKPARKSRAPAKPSVTP